LTAEEIFRGRLIMAPMTRGTNLPFRRLATECGAEVCLGEMAYAHKVIRSGSPERALLRRHADERFFGVQLAGKRPEVLAEAARVAQDMGADFVDVNLGCPIDDATRRGYGASLLKRASRVGEIVAAMKAAVSIPVTIKMRLGWSSEKPTFLKIARAAEEAGADAMTLHPRSRAQRYRRPADWDRVTELVEAVSVPVIGNGDIFSWQGAHERLQQTGCAAVMTGRWALSKPWLFREFREQRDLPHDGAARLAVLRRFVELCREHFGDDERGRKRIRWFLVFHQDFFRRYRRGAGQDAVNSSNPRDWGEEPQDELESWLCRGDLGAAEALCDWLIDGAEPCLPPLTESEDPRAVKTRAYG